MGAPEAVGSPLSTSDVLARITAGHFCAGIVLVGDVVTEAAPILRYMIGWDRDRVREYCRRKGWGIAVVR